VCYQLFDPLEGGCETHFLVLALNPIKIITMIGNSTIKQIDIFVLSSLSHCFVDHLLRQIMRSQWTGPSLEVLAPIQ
jgi:hypothetical protein